MEGGAHTEPELLLLGEGLQGGHLPLPHLQQERGVCAEQQLVLEKPGQNRLDLFYQKNPV